MMADNEHSILKIASNLAMACFISGVVIGSVYYVTAPVAAEKAVQMKQESMKALVSDADSFQPVDGHEGWFAAMKGGAAKAYIVPSETKGYGGRIKMLVAVSADGKVIDFNILEHNETPGLAIMLRNRLSAASLPARPVSISLWSRTKGTKTTFRP